MSGYDDLKYCCPKCRSRLVRDDEKYFGVNGCSFCTGFPIQDGIPNFIGRLQEGERESNRVFGAEWLDYKDYDANNLEKMLSGLPSQIFSGKNVLEVGCGGGRHTLRLLNKYGAKSVVAIDMSEAVREARRKNLNDARVTFVRCSALEMPFEDCSFDLAFSLGVLMHTVAPRTAFGNMVRTVRPGGEIVVWVYAKSLRKNLVELLRFFTKKMSTRWQKFVAESLSILFYPIVLIHKIPGIRTFDHFNEYSQYDFYTYRTDMFDRIAAPLIDFYGVADITTWFEGEGCVDIRVTSYKSFFIVGYGRKP